MDWDTIPDKLEELRGDAPDEVQEYFLQMEDYWERKLWHELTTTLIKYFERPESKPQRLVLYNTFIKSFADKINTLNLVTLGLKAAEQCKDMQVQLEMEEALAKKVDGPDSQDAYVYARVAVASLYMKQREFGKAREILDACQRILDTFDTVESKVHAAFYKNNADYYKIKFDYAAYYRNCLLYLACVDVPSLPLEDRTERAMDLAVAALLAETIYNFGELLLHPILDALVNTEVAWLRDLLFAFNRGDLVAWDALSGNLKSFKMLAEARPFLHQKICLAALTEAVFRRPPHDRTMRFVDIGVETKVKPDQIEHLIMKALSLGLLKGTIDQVAQVAKINWVQPKVLDMKQIESMKVRLKEWDSNVNQLGNWIEHVGGDMWAA
ncbi:hypothetical protein EJ06DRAFT_477638 [Trichodelitschia bisporula]|uniref:PCI domain-containing protein n=1 Tax=Trichodelitschia bisporula TaxID=703511 RepID=A0A6G1HVR6_9PEZI|nr:hypothetical protein EJ06DRAFT_477638 [Trichodelitschia bisporula]